MICLRIGWEYSTDADIVCTCLLGGNRFLECAGGNTDDLIRSEDLSGFLIFHIALTNVDAIGINFFGGVNIIVDDERNTMPGSNFFDLHCFLYHFFMGKFFFAKLQKRRSVFENVFYNIGKTSAV